MIGWQWSIGVTNINNFILKTYKTNQRNAFLWFNRILREYILYKLNYHKALSMLCCYI